MDNCDLHQSHMRFVLSQNEIFKKAKTKVDYRT